MEIEIEVLKNQLVIMKALLLVLPQGELHTAMQGRIIFTEARIRGIS